MLEPHHLEVIARWLGSTIWSEHSAESRTVCKGPAVALTLSEEGSGGLLHPQLSLGDPLECLCEAANFI